MNFKRRFWKPIVALDEADQGDFEILFSIRDRHGTTVGEVMATLPPGDGRIFVRSIKVEEQVQRRGFGTATVHALAQKFGRAVSPVRERGDGRKFWPQVPALSGRSFVVTEEVDPDELSSIVSKAQSAITEL